MRLVMRQYFVYGQTMDAAFSTDVAVSRIAAAIGEPARTRMLYCLMDGHARTSTELAMEANVSPSTASVHLARLKAECLIAEKAQGRHRYYSLESPNVARALERLSVLAGGRETRFVPKTPDRLRNARTCYDHLAGAVAVTIHDRFLALKWIEPGAICGDSVYDVSPSGAKGLSALGIDVQAARGLRRRFAYGCLDWSERRPHLGGALGAAMLKMMMGKRWITRELDSRAVSITSFGKRELKQNFSVEL
jgi:DNA-binding transcriptional ArsR family regulator